MNGRGKSGGSRRIFTSRAIGVKNLSLPAKTVKMWYLGFVPERKWTPNKAYSRWLIAGFLLFSLASCSQSSPAPGGAPTAAAPLAPQPPATPTATPRPIVAATPTPTPNKPKPKRKPRPQPVRPAVAVPTPPRRPPGLGISKEFAKKYLPAAAWAKKPNTEAWTVAVIKAVRLFRENLETARDIEDFCPGYERAGRQSREICWLRLVSKVAKFESGFDIHQKYKEPMGMISVGLLQLSDGECLLSRNRKPDLENPVHNLKCGVAIMARLIKRDRYIDGPIWARGAAAYWSTLRSPYNFLGLHLGKKPFVKTFTQNYLRF